MKNILASATLASGLYAFAGAAMAECGSVSIAEMNWGSAGVAANVDKIILEAGYGCKVTLVPGDTNPTFTSMNEKAEPDMAPEFWVNSVRTLLAKATGEARLVVGAEILSDGGIEGWWMPKFIADANPGIRTVAQALAHPELFPKPQDPSRGAVHNCPSDWSCRISTANLFRATGAAAKGFDLIDMGSAAGFDGSIASAFETETGWLGYYWAPTAILGKYEMVKLSFEAPYDKADWDSCTAVVDCANPKVNSYPTSQAFTLVTRQFTEKAAVAMDYIKARQWTNNTVNGLLAWQEDNKASNDAAARYFLKSSEEVWTKWLAPDVATKVKAAL